MSNIQNDEGQFVPVNWNRIEDPVDDEVWKRVTKNFWLPEKVPLSNDVPSWRGLTENERLMVMRVFVGLTLLDTMQGVVGIPEMLEDAKTQHEEAVLLNFGFMEAVHAKSYSSIFSTLSSTSEIDAAFAWSRTNPYLQKKAEIINRYYSGDDPLKRKISSSLLENFMFYSGFFMPLRYASHGQLTNTADIIRLIIRDESVHGYYIGHKFQQQLEEHIQLSWDPTIAFASYQTFAYDMLQELHENEIQYTHSLYADAHPEWVPEILEYLRFNGNRSMEFLGFEGVFKVDTAKLPKDILASLNPDTSETHDFFSGSGSSYVIGTVEEISDEDWEL